MKRNTKHSGFTLIEATGAMLMLALAAAGILVPFANAASVQAEGARQTLAANLATEMMEKVLLSEPNTILSSFGGYVETKGAMLDTKGVVLSDSVYTGFSRSVVSEAVTVKSVPLVNITVSVAYEGNEMTRVTTLAGQ